MLKFDKLTGLVAAPYTPMKKSGNIKYDTIKPYANLLANSGVSGAFICGTTGEGMSLSSEERMKVAETWQKQARPDLKSLFTSATPATPKPPNSPNTPKKSAAQRWMPGALLL